MNRTQYVAMLEALAIDKNNLKKYKERYQYAYILSDGIFKIVFAEEESHSLLISLINAMLNLKGSEAIKSIVLEMQEFPGIFNKKNCILDIIGTTNAGEKVLVEIQQQGDKFFRDRVEYYIARVIENQVHKSEKYELPKIYFLGLLDFEMFPEEPTEYIHHVDEMCHGKKFFPKLQKIFVEIDKFFELEKAGITKNDQSDAAEWLRAIKSIIKEEPMPEKLLHNETFKRLQESVKLVNFIDEIFNIEVKNMNDLQAKYEIGFAEGREKGYADGREFGFDEGREKGFSDGHERGFDEGKEQGYADGHERGFDEGKEQGYADGHERGFDEGKEQGYADGHERGFDEGKEQGFDEGKLKGFSEGEFNKAKEMAKKMLLDNIPIKQIVIYSGLSEEEILKL